MGDWQGGGDGGVAGCRRQSMEAPSPRATNEMAASTSSSSATSGWRTRSCPMPRKRISTSLAACTADSKGSMPWRCRSASMISASARTPSSSIRVELFSSCRVAGGVEPELLIEQSHVSAPTCLVSDQGDEIRDAGLRWNLGVLQRRSERLHLPVVVRLEQGEEEVLLVLEVGVHGALREAGDGRDLVERGPVEPPLVRRPPRPRPRGARGSAVAGARG